MGIKNQRDTIFLKSCTLAIIGNTIDNNQLQGFTGSGLNGEAARSYARSSSQSYTNQYVFLPSDPDELVDQLKLLYF